MVAVLTRDLLSIVDLLVVSVSKGEKVIVLQYCAHELTSIKVLVLTGEG